MLVILGGWKNCGGEGVCIQSVSYLESFSFLLGNAINSRPLFSRIIG